jgi:hypothetical protein
LRRKTKRKKRAEPSALDGVGQVDVLNLDGVVLKNETSLRDYQRRWVKDGRRFTLAVKSAQIGYSTATAAWAVDRCLVMPKRTVVFLSRSERQSLELAHRAKEWLDGYHGAAADWLEATPFAGTSTLQHEIRFANGSRIIALAANPDTARGYTGDVCWMSSPFTRMRRPSSLPSTGRYCWDITCAFSPHRTASEGSSGNWQRPSGWTTASGRTGNRCGCGSQE